MLKSMTGFGRGEYEDADFSVTVEMKTVNHRYNEVAIRLPRFLNPLEDKIRKTILKTVSRGRIDVFVNADYTTSGNCTLKVDKNLAAAYHKALQEVGAAIGADAAGINAAAEIMYMFPLPCRCLWGWRASVSCWTSTWKGRRWRQRLSAAD